MSPTAKELVANRPLRGDELAKIIQADVANILANDCMLTSRVAYGRVSYELRVVLHMDNPAFSTSETIIKSKPMADDVVAAQPELAAIENSPPLESPGDNSYVSAIERHRDINSPNVSRIEHGLPITVIRPGFDTGGNAISVEEGVIYPPEVVEDVVNHPVDSDITQTVKRSWSLGSGGDNLL
jgi:hypothetical protein